MPRLITRQNIFLALGLVLLVVMTMWDPISQNLSPSAPVSVREIARESATLTNGTLMVPKSGIVLDDGTVLASVVAIGRRGDVLISNASGDESYQIVWLQETNDYLLSIQSEPFEKNRERAEAEFLKALGLNSIETACSYPVFVQPAQWLPLRPSTGLSYCS